MGQAKSLLEKRLQDDGGLITVAYAQYFGSTEKVRVAHPSGSPVIRVRTSPNRHNSNLCHDPLLSNNNTHSHIEKKNTTDQSITTPLRRQQKGSLKKSPHHDMRDRRMSIVDVTGSEAHVRNLVEEQMTARRRLAVDVRILLFYFF